jgi:hypothetical protein
MPVVPFRPTAEPVDAGPQVDPVFLQLGAGVTYQAGRLFHQEDAIDRKPTDPGNPADELHPNKLAREKDPREITDDSGQSVDYDTADHKKPIGYKTGSKDPGHAEIEGFPKEEGLFEPIKEHMAGPTKPMADKAVAMTKKLHDLYKSGDPDAVKVVQDWEGKTLGRGYNDTEAGKALKKESFDKYGSKTEMTKSAKWEAFMSIYGNLMGDMLEREDVSPKDKEAYESMSRFDREGRTQMDLRSLYRKLR